MKIVLLSPAGAMHRHNGNFSTFLRYAPLTLTTLASLIPEELNLEIKIFDESIQLIPYDLESDIICITAITGTALRAYKWADYFRSKGIKVILGGVHPTLLPEEAIEHADSVVTGFAEKTFPQLLYDFKNGRLKRIYHQSKNFDYSKTPIPKRYLLKSWKYITKSSIQATRGCMHSCNFCVYPAAFGEKYYKRSVKEVIAEIEQLKNKYITFIDINIISDIKYAKSLFKELIPLKKNWFGLATSEVTDDDELFQLLVKSGCKGLLIGFESITSSTLKSITKSFNNVNNYENMIKKLHNHGISINGTFAFGSDEEDKSVFEKTVEMVIKLKIDLPRYSILTPFPKTKLYNELEFQNRIFERSWDMYDVEHCVFKPKKMSPQELEEGLLWAWKETYSYSSIIKRMTRFNSMLLLSVVTNIGYKKYVKNFHQFNKLRMTDNSDIPDAANKDNHENNIY